MGRNGRSERREPYLWLALALALVAALPALIGPGIVNTRAGGDAPFLVQRVHQLVEILRAGSFPVRWMPDAAHGLGYPFFHYYAALPYYLAATLSMAGAGVLWGIKATQACGFLLAGYATYRLAREIDASPAGALLASAAYTFAPFHLVNVYVRGDSLSEFWAMALFPLILWALARLAHGVTAPRIAALGASYGLLALCHNISALLFSPLVGVALLVAAWARRRERGAAQRESSSRAMPWRPALGTGEGGGLLLLAGAGALALGLLASAWFWAPALRDQPLVQLQDQTTGYFHYSGHFRAGDLIQWRPIHDYAITGERNPFGAGLAQVAVAVVGLIGLGIDAARRRALGLPAALAMLATAAYTWLITPSSRWVWDHVPLLPYTQFPWRLLSVQALGLALVAAHAPRALRGRWGAALGLALCAAVTVAGLAGLRVDRLPLRETDVTADRLMFYEAYSGNIGTTVRHEYLPAGMVPEPHTSARDHGSEHAAPLVLNGALRTADLLARGPTRQVWDLDVEAPALVAFHIAAFPGWRATVDGAPREIEPIYGLGLVGLRLEPGRHTVTLAFGTTRFWRVAEWASLLGALGLLALALAPCRTSRRCRARALRIGAVVALAVVWLVVAPERERVENWEGPLVADWDRAPYLHFEREGVWFGELGLLGYDYGAMLPTRGHFVPVSLRWAGPTDGMRLRLELQSPSAHLFAPAPVWSEIEAPIASSWTSLGLPLPADLPPGEYVVRLRVYDAEGEVSPRTASGVGMGGLTLMPLHVLMPRLAPNDAPALGAFGPSEEPPAVSLLAASTRRVDEGLVEVALEWRCERQAPLNYYYSIRLLGRDGAQIASRDIPPLLGSYPTALWRPGETIADRVLIPVPADAPDAPGVEVVLYDRITLGGAGSVRVPTE